MSKLIWKMADDSISSFSLLRLNVQEKKSYYYLDGYVKCCSNFPPDEISTSITTYLGNTQNTLSK